MGKGQWSGALALVFDKIRDFLDPSAEDYIGYVIE